MKRRDCPSRLRSLLRDVTLLAAWCARTLEREGFTPGQVAKAARDLVVAEGHGQSRRWRLKTEGEKREEMRLAAEKRGEPIVESEAQRKRRSAGNCVLRDPWADKPPRFAPPGPRRQVNACEVRALPIGIRAPGEAYLCLWCARRAEEA